MSFDRREWLAAVGSLGAVGFAGAAGTATAATPASAQNGLSGGQPLDGDALPNAPPSEPREFRAAWVATVGNIDWPARAGDPVAMQREQARSMLERARAIGLNAIVLQVRPAGDAFYPSRLEPWSEFLTGAQGRAPQPRWDPLAYWLAEAHRLGLELHAWINPFRARAAVARSPLARPHLGLRVSAAVKPYGEQLWMDPAHPAARAHTLAVAEDLLRRYDIDGLHIDDYFYPYPVASDGAELAFPDSEAYLRYLGGGGVLPLPDWRRAHVDALVQALHEKVRRVRPQARFGISPFGLGRPDRRPPGVSGFSQYDKLYADVERWLEEGWLDYLAPQLYWPIAQEGQPFGLLLQHWVQANRHGRHLWPGLFASALRGSADAGAGAPGRTGKGWPARELLEQMALLGRGGEASGHIHFSFGALLQNRDGIADALKAGPYAQAALPPVTPWLGGKAPAAPRLVRTGQAVRIEPDASGQVARYAVWRLGGAGGAWKLDVRGPGERLVAREGAELLVVSAVSRLGHASARRAVRWG